eukprot:6004608-Alexandrium_andersonii.AAC.1
MAFRHAWHRRRRRLWWDALRSTASSMARASSCLRAPRSSSRSDSSAMMHGWLRQGARRSAL